MRDDPTFGYRYLADEARRAGWRMSRRTAWKLCSQAGILSSAQRRRRGKGKKAGPPVFDDHVQRVFRGRCPEPGLAHRHHRAPHDDRRQALLLRDQRRLLKPDRGVLDQRPDDLEARGRRTPQRRRPPRRCRRMHLACRQGQPVSKPRHGPGTAPARHGRFDGPSRRRATTQLWRAGRSCRPTSSTSSGGPPGRICGSPSSSGSSGSITDNG